MSNTPKEAIIMNMDNIYLEEEFYKETNYEWVDCSDVSGTNCYCDNVAEKILSERIKEYFPYGIHFIDSGNYHYITKLWTDKMREPFVLVVFDHHTDMQKPRYGDILTCGSWVQCVIDHNPYLKKVFLIGASKELIDQIPPMYKDMLICMDEEHLLRPDKWSFYEEHFLEYPIYISIDKDVLSADTVSTNWDQGSMTLTELESFLDYLKTLHQVVAVDICGEQVNSQNVFMDQKAITQNDHVNQELLELFEHE